MALILHHAGDAGSRRSTRARLAAICFVLAGLAIGSAAVARLVALPWADVATSLTVRSWPVAEARILSASLREVRVSARAGMEPELVLAVEYEFDAAGRTVSATGASLRDRSASEDRRLVSLYRRIMFARVTGHTMPVSYDPADPSRAYLDASVAWGNLLPGLGLGALLLLVSGQCFARAAERFRR